MAACAPPTTSNQIARALEPSMPVGGNHPGATKGSSTIANPKNTKPSALPEFMRRHF
jgi:hypothetical protein